MSWSCRFLAPQLTSRFCINYNLNFVSKQSCNLLSTTSRRKSAAVLSDDSFKVPSFGGSLWVKSPFNVEIKPLVTHDYPSLDRAFVKLLGADLSQRDKAKLHIDQVGHKLSVTGECTDPDTNEKVGAEIRIPIVHNVKAMVEGDATLKISDMMESDYCHLKSEKGEIAATKVKTKNLTIESEAGDIILNGQIQGNIKIENGTGSVIAEKRFLGTNLEITTDSGDIRVASSYCDQAKFSTNKGNMFLRNIHNESFVAVYESGDVKMQGVNGATNIFVARGDVECQVSHIKHESRIHVEEGDITLKLTDTHPVKISIDANEIIPDTKFKNHGTIEAKDNNFHYFATIQPNKFSPTLLVIAENGRVILESQDWAASLGLKLPLPKDMNIKGSS